MHEVSKKDALRIAEVFINTPGVSAVEVIGSVAREGRGNDLDLVLVVDGIAYATYVLSLNEKMMCGEDYYWDFRQERHAAALRSLNFSLPLRGWLRLATADVSLDLHLLPEGWKTRADEVQHHLRHNDPNFVSNIAKDAVELRSTSSIPYVKGVLWP